MRRLKPISCIDNNTGQGKISDFKVINSWFLQRGFIILEGYGFFILTGLAIVVFTFQAWNMALSLTNLDQLLKCLDTTISVASERKRMAKNMKTVNYITKFMIICYTTLAISYTIMSFISYIKKPVKDRQFVFPSYFPMVPVVEIGLKVIGRYFMILLGMFFVSLIFQIWNFVLVIRKLNLLMNNLATTMPLLLITLKLTMFRLKFKQVNVLISQIFRDWNNEKNVDVREVLIRNQKRAIILSNIITLCYNGLVLTFIVITIASYTSTSINDRQFVIQATYPMNAKKSPIFELLCLLQVVVAFFGTNGHAVLEGLLTISVLHANTKAFSVCKEISNYTETCLSPDSGKYSSKATQKLVKQHSEFITFTDSIQDIFSNVSFFHLLVMSLINCTVGFMLINLKSINQESIYELLMCVAYMLTALSAVLSYCIAGEYLKTQGTWISQKLYQMPWYKFKQNDTKMLAFMIMRSQRIVTVTVGNFDDLSLIYFTKIIKASVSYLSFLRAANFEKRVMVLKCCFPFDSTKTPIYEVIVLLQAFQATLLVVADTLSKSLLVACVLHVRARIYLLEYYIEQFSSNCIRNKGQRSDNEPKFIKDVIMEHSKILTLVKKIDFSYSYIILLQMVFSNIIICVTGFVIITAFESANMLLLIKFILFIIAMLLQCFTFCIASQYLRNKGELINKIVYNSFWYHSKPIEIKAIMFVISSTIRPLTLRGGKLFELSINTFVQILRTSFSYLSVLRAVYT
ncbi:uncharacterized protein LOC106636601 [Copidosoma floridanum]|uniref:uncharacterized protein LOC106636601 n=1 Tax=Copidosoma floridanum TaxID=29053 RepID=UPI0006C94AA4|nr:uncharacterized protein LOC106636601 [Copidosoma floridanum]